MKNIKLNARLSAYSRVEAVVVNEKELTEMTKCDVDDLFDNNSDCTVNSDNFSENEVTFSDIDALFK